jgi:hypothetical protein
MVHNHGALLQLTALIRVLRGENIDAAALRFEKNYDFLGHELRAKYEISVRSIGIYIKYLMSEGLKKTWYNFKKSGTLNKYRKETGIIGNYYSDEKNMDAVVIGSDEVFALHTGPTPILFGHAAPSLKVFAYAGSFGPTTYEDVCNRHCKAFVESGLSSMCGISVRDQNSRAVVEKLIGESPRMVCDPVLLYGFREEIASLKRPTDEKYLLVYAYDGRMDTSEEVTAIRNYANRKGLKIISPGMYHPWVDKNVDTDPVNLLAWFKYADCVVTDTFHGCVISIITETPMAVRTRDSNRFKLYNLLVEYGLDNRIVKSWDNLKTVFETPVDFAAVGRQVDLRRKDAMEYLREMITKEI